MILRMQDIVPKHGVKMEQYVIKGGNPLVGEVEIGGAKNAALPILAAAIMTDETVVIENVPDVRDTNALLQAMKSIGVIVENSMPLIKVISCCTCSLIIALPLIVS